MTNGFTETIEKIMAEIETHVSSLKSNPEWTQIEKLYRALSTIEGLAEVPQTTLAEIFGFSDAGSRVSVRAGEFIGMDALDAAKAYLEKKQDSAASLDEIVDALQTGGANLVARDSLRTSLARSTWDVVKAPGQELYQLVKYAPHVKRGKKKASTPASASTQIPQGEPPESEPEEGDVEPAAGGEDSA
ncbi:MAG: hypothetical protein ABSC62_04530 [Terracidiphilus sp.]|jgi:hypothetical protein